MIILSIYLLVTVIVFLRMIAYAHNNYIDSWLILAICLSVNWPLIFIALILKIIPDWWEDPWLCSK